jgi:sulfite reductase (NADPH) flavoprotein alpha-component
MLASEKIKMVNELVAGSTKEELIWLNGYINGLIAGSSQPAIINGNGNRAGVVVKKLSLVFGTETGNSKKLASQFALLAKKKGITVKLSGLDQYRLGDLSTEEYLFVIISTHGEGEPPSAAKKFYDHIHQDGLKLPGLKYSVLALGDSAYPLFCKTGEDVDVQLKRAGAKPVVPIQKCDVDFETAAAEWFNNVLKALGEEQVSNSSSKPIPAALKSSGKKYYNGVVLTNINLNDRGSNKETFHIEIGAGETIVYEPGDSLAIIPANKKIIVEAIIQCTGIDRTRVIQTQKATATTEELLTKYLNICYLLTSTIKKYASVTGQEIPDGRMDLIDLLRNYPVKDAGQFAEVITILLPIAPRLYSISSSPAIHSREIHITVSKKQFYVQEEPRYGLCSDFLGELPVDSAVNFYIHKNRNFKPAADDKDMIMIGPGTGIAPFRSFLTERDTRGATGRNWLFFGEQYFTTDFLYQAEIQNHVQAGVLSKIDLAFSRDQPKKIYVQHRMLEKAKELYQWIEGGAFVYISGTKDPVSIDIENTLLQIIEEQGKSSAVEARKFLDQMKKADRYQKDVY